jgi:predicted Zn-dependent protease
MTASVHSVDDRRTDVLAAAQQALELVPAGLEAQVVVRWSSHALTRFANSRIHQNIDTEDVLVSVKLAQEGRVAMATTNRTDADSLRDVVARAHEAARVRPVDPGWPGVAGPEPEPGFDHWDEATASATPDQRAAVVAAFLGAGGEGGQGREGAQAREGAGYCDSLAVACAVVTSAGQRAAGRYTRATVDGIFMRPPEGGHTPAGYGHATSIRLGDLDGESTGRDAARLCDSSTGAKDIEPREYPVVLMPECVAEVVAFLADGFSAKTVQDGRSFAEVGLELFDPGFRLVDDVGRPDAPALAFDTDGTPRRSVPLAVDGVCRGLLHDRRTAARQGGGTRSTGHGHLASDSWGPAPAGLEVGSGDLSTEELIGGLERGIVVTCFNYCRVLDSKTMEVTGLTRNGTFWVEGGKIVRPLTNLRFTQSFVEALAPGAVSGVGSASRLADCEWGSGLVRTPPLRLAGWRFTGGAAG